MDIPTSPQTPGAPAEPLLLTVSQAAKRLGLSRSSFYKLRDQGAIRVGYVLGRPVVAAADVEKFAAELFMRELRK